MHPMMLLTAQPMVTSRPRPTMPSRPHSECVYMHIYDYCYVFTLCLSIILFIESLNELSIEVIEFIMKWVYLLYIFLTTDYIQIQQVLHHIELNTLTIYQQNGIHMHTHDISRQKILKRSTTVCGFLFM